MKKLLSSAVCCLALLAGGAAIPDPPHMPKRLPKVCRIGGKAAAMGCILCNAICGGCCAVIYRLAAV